MPLFKCDPCRRTYRCTQAPADRELVCPKCRQPLNLIDPEASLAAPAALPPLVKAAAADASRRAGRFVLVHEVGRGAMGAVHQAWDTGLRRWVALKILMAETTDPDLLERFRQEAAIVATLDHPNIAPVYDVLKIDDRYAIVMKFIEGQTFHRAFLAETSPPVPVEDAVRYLRDASLGMGYAHGRGFVHRDIKPENLMLDREGRVYILDFGLAKVVSASRALTGLGQLMGTPAYMSPEQALGLARDVDPRSDIFSLGATLWTLLTRRRPFQGKSDVELARSIVQDPTPSVRKLRPEVPEEVDRVLAKAMEKDREARFPTGVELASALNECLLALEARRETGGVQESMSRPGRPRTVLMIEDDAGVAAIVRKTLEQDGLNVMHYADGLAAMREVEDLQPDIVLLDIQLPGMGGWEILDRLRSLPTYVHVPIIILSSEVGEENIVRGFQLGADDYLEKPFSMAVLKARLRHQLLKRREPE